MNFATATEKNEKNAKSRRSDFAVSTIICTFVITSAKIRAILEKEKSTNPAQDRTERAILGIDPGTNLLGYGLIRVSNRTARMVVMGVIDLRRCRDVYQKLGRIYERVAGIIDSFHPDIMAVEAPFFGKNVQSMLKLGRAQGVAIASAISRGVPVHEYAPMKIKMAITGNGQASKEQVAAILKKLLLIRDEDALPYLDATDALGAAYCHFLEETGRFRSTASQTSWADFVKANGNRVSAPVTPVNAKLRSLLRKTPAKRT